MEGIKKIDNISDPVGAVRTLYSDKELESVRHCIDNVKEIESILTLPTLERVNEVTKQENSSKFLAYLVQYVFSSICIK